MGAIIVEDGYSVWGLDRVAICDWQQRGGACAQKTLDSRSNNEKKLVT